MKKLFLPLLIVLLASCQQNDWIDWKLQNDLWIEQNKQANAIKITSSGLQYKVLFQGNEHDIKPNSRSTVYVDYEGKLINGAVFDSGSNTAFDFASDNIIAGFVEGLKKINVHGDYILYIPYDLAYGADGAGTEGNYNFVPPYSVLIFTVHLRSVVN